MSRGKAGAFVMGLGMAVLFTVQVAACQTLNWLHNYVVGQSSSGYNVISDSGGYFLVGSAYFATGNGDYQGLIVRTNHIGEQQWAQTYGDSNYTEFFDGAAIFNSALYVVGTQDTGGFSHRGTLWKFTLDGQLLWTHRYNSIFGDLIDVRITPSGHLLSNAYGTLVELDTLGNFVQYLWGNPSPAQPPPQFTLLPEQGCVVASNPGWAAPGDTNRIHLYWLNAVGQVTDSFPYPIRNSCNALSITPMSQDEVVVGGRAQTGGQFYEFQSLLFRMARDGTVSWEWLGSRFGSHISDVHAMGSEIWWIYGNTVPEVGLGPWGVGISSMAGDSLRGLALLGSPQHPGLHAIGKGVGVALDTLIVTGSTDPDGNGSGDTQGLLAKISYDPVRADEPDRHPVGPSAFIFLPANPNPFNAVTTLNFSLPVTGHARIEIFDITGRHVQTVSDQQYSAGWHTIRFDAGELPSGLYFARASNGGFHSVQKLVLLK